jgi:hypothetical protein
LEISQIILANNKNLKIRIQGKYSQQWHHQKSHRNIK